LAGRVPLKIAYVLTCRVLGLVVLVHSPSEFAVTPRMYT
jgi:hypothetical protein